MRVTIWAVAALFAGKFRHIQEANVQPRETSPFKGKIVMRFVVATLLATASFLAPIGAFADSADVEGTIKKVDVKGLSLTLDDGRTYQAPEEFNFEGLKAGVKVIVFYTEVDGKRVINDLDVVQ